MAHEGNGIYSYFTYLSSGFQGFFSIHNDSSGQTIEPVPQDCSTSNAGKRAFKVRENPLMISFAWGNCEPAGPPSEVEVTFQVLMEEDADLSRGVYVVGEINAWEITRMNPEGGNLFEKSFLLPPGSDSLAYYYLTTATWDNYKDFREVVPEACALKWGVDRVIIVPPFDTVVSHLWGSCMTIAEASTQISPFVLAKGEQLVYPNPASNACFIKIPGYSGDARIDLFSSRGEIIAIDPPHLHNAEYKLNLGDLSAGLYFIRIRHKENTLVTKIVVGG
jgi:hypothetical protein